MGGYDGGLCLAQPRNERRVHKVRALLRQFLIQRLTVIRRSFLYVASVILAFWFTFQVLKAEPDTMPIFIPICIDTGIFLGVSLEQTWSSWREIIQQRLSPPYHAVKDFYHASQLALLTWLANPERFRSQEWDQETGGIISNDSGVNEVFAT